MTNLNENELVICSKCNQIKAKDLFISHAKWCKECYNGYMRSLRKSINTVIINLKGEEWRMAPGYEGYYMVSNIGRIKSIQLNRRNKFTKRANKEILLKERVRLGYNRPMFWVEGKGKCVPAHRIIAMAFIPNQDNKPFINHKDGNGLNNNIDNLEWCTVKENTLHAVNVLGKMKSNRLCVSGINNHKARKIVQMNLDRKIIKIWGTSLAASKTLGIPKSSISSALCKRVQTCAGFIWEYYKAI